MQDIGRVVVIGCLIGLFGQVYAANGETVGERFENAMKKRPSTAQRTTFSQATEGATS